VPAFTETRDTHLFSRRVGDLPLQQEGEQYDYRPLLHRCRGREGGGGAGRRSVLPPGAGGA
jgi:hypothetical protein